jgi:hypothetical protein
LYGRCVIWFGALGQVVGVLTECGPNVLLVGAGAMAGVLLLAVLAAAVPQRSQIAGPARGVTRRSLRERTVRAGIPRHRDPDASGRSRPRAPTALLAVA